MSQLIIPEAGTVFKSVDALLYSALDSCRVILNFMELDNEPMHGTRLTVVFSVVTVIAFALIMNFDDALYQIPLCIIK